MVGWSVFVSYSFHGLLLSAFIYTLLIAFTWGLARERRLPAWYALYGLVFITGSVYVMTLAARNDPEELRCARTARSLSKHRTLLGLLTFYMGAILVIGVLGLAMVPLVGASWVHIALNDREAMGWPEALTVIPPAVFLAAHGLFHFAVTRRRVKVLLNTRQRWHGLETTPHRG